MFSTVYTAEKRSSAALIRRGRSTVARSIKCIHRQPRVSAHPKT